MFKSVICYLFHRRYWYFEGYYNPGEFLVRTWRVCMWCGRIRRCS